MKNKMKRKIVNRIKDEVDISKKKKFSKKRAFVIFLILIIWILSLMIVWGGKVHNVTGVSPKDFTLQENNN